VKLLHCPPDAWRGVKQKYDILHGVRRRVRVMATMSRPAIIKRTLRAFFPRPFAKLDRFRNQRRSRKRKELTRRFVEHYGLEVKGGPFSGMDLVPAMLDNSALPTLVGSFEQELQEVIFQLRGYRSIINIGSSYGYYAVGFARRFPKARIHAFETDAATRSVCQELAEVNGVADRVQLHGTCTAEVLAGLRCEDPCLVFCDCEGGEYEILRPSIAPRLLEMDLIVELHDKGDVHAPERLLGEFEATHTIQVFHYGQRDPDAYPALQIFHRRQRLLALDELRWRGLRWAVMKVKRRN